MGFSQNQPEPFDAAKSAEGVPKSDNVAEGEKRDEFNLSKYEPTYFAYGYPTTKVQFSFKYRLIRDFSFYAGYTQVMFWELREESIPFKDVNFNPEFFYRFPSIGNYIESIDVIPYWHKSNGKAGPDSRSVNAVAARVNGQYELSTTKFRYSLKLLKYYGVAEENADWERYHGPYELTVSYLQFFRYFIDRGELSVKFYAGGKYGQNLDKGGRELTLSFRIFGFDITPSFYFSVFNGYGESLILYDHKDTIFRAGILL